MHHINPKTLLAQDFLMTINSQWLMGISFPRWWRELRLHVIDLKEQHPMLLRFTSHWKHFDTERVSKEEEKNVYCTRLDCSLIYT